MPADVVGKVNVPPLMKQLFLVLTYLCLACPIVAQNASALFPLPDAGGKWGYVDAQKNVKISYQFMGASPFCEDRALVALPAENEEGFTLHVIDSVGKVLFQVQQFTYSPIHLFQMSHVRYSEGLLGMQLSKKEKNLTYLDKMGKPAIMLKDTVDDFPLHFPFSNGFAYLRTYDGYQTYINKKGEKKISLPYNINEQFGSLDRDFSDGVAVVFTKEKSKLGYINTKGKYLPITRKFKDIEDLGAMSEGIAFMALPDPKNETGEPKYVLLKKNGKTVPISVDLRHSSPASYISDYKFSHGLALVRVRYADNYTYLDKNGKVAFQLPESITKPDYAELSATGQNFHQGLACWKVPTKDRAFKLVYITTAGKVAFESPSIKEYQ